MAGYFYNGVSDYRPGLGSDSDSRFLYVMYPEALSESHLLQAGFGSMGYNTGYKSNDGKTIFWYGDTGMNQLNLNGAKYFYFAIG